jgi:hypothetical protein
VDRMLKNLDFRIGLFFLLLALLFGLLMVPTVGEDWRETAGVDVEFFTVGPRFFPYLSAGIMALLSALIIVDSALQVKSGSQVSRSPIRKEQLKPVLVFMGIGTVYILSLSFLGVLVATPLCLMVFFWYFDLRKWGWILPLAIGITALIYICFEKLMMVPLPKGFLEM